MQYYLSLQPRQLPSRYFYDDLGSALFDAICRLPWYGVTRAERACSRATAREILARVPALSTIVELGPGNGEKLVALVDAARQRCASRSPARRHLAERARAVEPRAGGAAERRHYDVRSGSTRPAWRRPRRETRSGRALTLFLGSNIGNFDRPGADAFLREIRASLMRGDMLLVGADLVKPERDLLLAYDDPLGVTAAFNRNLLVRINRELGGRLRRRRFAHRAVWSPAHSRVEMHLVSRVGSTSRSMRRIVIS